LLVHGWWFSLGTPETSITKTDSHDIAEILLKVALKHQKSINPLKCLHQYLHYSATRAFHFNGNVACLSTYYISCHSDRYFIIHVCSCEIQYGVNYKKVCTRLTAASDKVYQLFVHGQWFSPGTPASSTTKTGRHDIVEILVKVALNN
jgi:hypothetical protein